MIVRGGADDGVTLPGLVHLRHHAFQQMLSKILSPEWFLNTKPGNTKPVLSRLLVSVVGNPVGDAFGDRRIPPVRFHPYNGFGDWTFHSLYRYPNIEVNVDWFRRIEISLLIVVAFAYHEFSFIFSNELSHDIALYQASVVPLRHILTAVSPAVKRILMMNG